MNCFRVCRNLVEISSQSPARPVDDLVRDDPACRLLEHHLRLQAAHLEARRDTCGPLDEMVVEERDAHLERVRH